MDRGNDTSAEKSVSLGPVEVGNYDVILSVQNERTHDSFDISVVPTSLVEGSNQLTMAIPKLYPLTLRFETEGGVVSLEAADKGGPRSYREVGSTKEVTFTTLPAGRYTIQRFSDGVPAFMDVEVPSSGPVMFEAKLVNAMRISITDRDGDLAKMGFIDGDLVIGLGDQEFTDMVQMQTAWMTALAEETCTAKIQRGSRVFDLEIDPKIIMNPGRAGGDFEPVGR